MEIIGNAVELKAFDRLEDEIRLIGYFKSEDSDREWGGRALGFILAVETYSIVLFNGPVEDTVYCVPFITVLPL